MPSDLIRERLPVRVKRQNRGIELRSDSIGTETALGGFESTTVAGLILSLSSAESETERIDALVGADIKMVPRRDQRLEMSKTAQGFA